MFLHKRQEGAGTSELFPLPILFIFISIFFHELFFALNVNTIFYEAPIFKRIQVNVFNRAEMQVGYQNSQDS